MNSASLASSEELNTTCRALVAVCRERAAAATEAAAQRHVSTGAKLLEQLRELLADGHALTDIELIRLAVMRAGYLDR